MSRRAHKWPKSRHAAAAFHIGEEKDPLELKELLESCGFKIEHDDRIDAKHSRKAEYLIALVRQALGKPTIDCSSVSRHPNLLQPDAYAFGPPLRELINCVPSTCNLFGQKGLADWNRHFCPSMLSDPLPHLKARRAKGQSHVTLLAMKADPWIRFRLASKSLENG